MENPKPPAGEKIISFVPIGEVDAITLNRTMVSKFVANPTRSGALPGERDVVLFMALCQARRLNPFAGDAFLVGYDGKNGPEYSLITSISALLKRAELSGHLAGIESGLIVERDGTGIFMDCEGAFVPPGAVILGGWAKVHRDDRTMPHVARIGLAGYEKPTKIWQEQKALMIVKCAKAAAIREAFPSETSGLYLAEESPAERRSAGRVVEDATATDDTQTAALPPPGDVPPLPARRDVSVARAEAMRARMKAKGAEPGGEWADARLGPAEQPEPKPKSAATPVQGGSPAPEPGSTPSEQEADRLHMAATDLANSLDLQLGDLVDMASRRDKGIPQGREWHDLTLPQRGRVVDVVSAQLAEGGT